MVTAALAHVPGDYGAPLVGHSLAFARDARAQVGGQWRRYGDVFSTHLLGTPVVMFVTPQATREILLDRHDLFSSTEGWSWTLGPLFDRGLMLRDFDDHRFHRGVMQQAFRRDALAGYLGPLHRVIDRHLDALGTSPTVDIYAFLKTMTLDIALEVFVGRGLGLNEMHRLNRAFVDTVRAAVTPLRIAVPGSRYRRGLRARGTLQRFFAREVERRRRAPEAPDLLSRLCHATDDEGASLPADEVVDHMIFLLMAAHDTTTSSLTVMLWEIARRREWQQRLAAEVDGLAGADVDLDNERALPDVDLVFREATRMHPPVPFFPRTVVSGTTVDGWDLPAGTVVAVATLLLHRHSGWWTAPDTFDPERFARGRDEHRGHSHVFVPFGGGAHTCIGSHFSRLVTKAVMARMLARHRFDAPVDRPVQMRPVPIPRPRRRIDLAIHGRMPRPAAPA